MLSVNKVQQIIKINKDLSRTDMYLFQIAMLMSDIW